MQSDLLYPDFNLVHSAVSHPFALFYRRSEITRKQEAYTTKCYSLVFLKATLRARSFSRQRPLRGHPLAADYVHL